MKALKSLSKYLIGTPNQELDKLMNKELAKVIQNKDVAFMRRLQKIKQQRGR